MHDILEFFSLFFSRLFIVYWCCCHRDNTVYSDFSETISKCLPRIFTCSYTHSSIRCASVLIYARWFSLLHLSASKKRQDHYHVSRIQRSKFFFASTLTVYEWHKHQTFSHVFAQNRLTQIQKTKKQHRLENCWLNIKAAK